MGEATDTIVASTNNFFVYIYDTYLNSALQPPHCAGIQASMKYLSHENLGPWDADINRTVAQGRHQKNSGNGRAGASDTGHSPHIPSTDTAKSHNLVPTTNESFIFKNAIIFHLFSFKTGISKVYESFQKGK